jgi:predicted TIM-barrel fold metal-dependent hydrolase
MKQLVAFAACMLAACATPNAATRTAPLVDYHQHLVSAAFQPLVKLPLRDGAALVRELDAAGIDRAVVLSVAYTYGDERKPIPEQDRDRMTRAENDWTSAQVMANSPRLIGFCSANPLREAALAELERCLKLPGMKGIKLHLGNSGISLRNADHLARMQQVYALAERLRVPVLVHMRARGGTNYGAEDARIFLYKVVPQAPDVDLIVAHLGGAGPGYGAQTDEVMAVFADAAERRDPRMRNVYFDVATDVTDETSPTEGALIAKRLRSVGLSHVLYGSDLTPTGGSIKAGWDIFRMHVPLTAAEFQTIMGNVLPFVR